MNKLYPSTLYNVRIAASVLVAKYQLGLGVLAIPSTFATLGFVPGLISLFALIVITTYGGLQSAYIRQDYRSIFSIGDVGYLLFGTFGRELIGVCYWIFVCLCTGASFLTFSISLVTISNNAICSLYFAAIAAIFLIIVGIFTRTLERVSWTGWLGIMSILVAVFTTTIAVLAQDRPYAAPPNTTDYGIRAFEAPSFSKAMTAVCAQLVSLAGSATFFSISAEMKRPEDFHKSILLGQSFVAFIYVLIGCIVYGRVGVYVTSPALASAGPLIGKIAYGLAIPGVLVTSIIYSHAGAKYTFVRLLRNTRHLEKSTMVHWITWVGSLTFLAIIGFVVAASVPFFNDLMGLIGALLGSLFSIIVPTFTSIYRRAARSEAQRLERQHQEQSEEFHQQTVSVSTSSSPSKRRHWFIRGLPGLDGQPFSMLRFSRASIDYIFMILGFYCLVAGTYASVQAILDSYATGNVSAPFTCAA